MGPVALSVKHTRLVLISAASLRLKTKTNAAQTAATENIYLLPLSNRVFTYNDDTQSRPLQAAPANVQLKHKRCVGTFE